MAEDLSLPFHELHLDGDNDEAPKTPRRSLSFAKHDLTPTSKQQGLQSKVRKTLEGDAEPNLNMLLEDLCIEEENSSVEQEELIDLMGIGNDISAKSRLSRAISAVFPNSSKRRVLRDTKQITIYTNLKLKINIQLEMAFGNTVADNVKKDIRDLEESMLSVWEELHKALEVEEENKRLVQSLLLRYRKYNTARENYLTALVNIYEKEIEKLKSGITVLSSTRQTALMKEMDTLKSKCNLGYRTGHLKEGKENIPTDVFSSLATSITNDCPIR